MAPETTQHERGASARERGDRAVVVDAARQRPATAPVGTRGWRHTVGTERRAVRTEHALHRLRIEMLERTIEQQNRQLQQVVDRYEQVMAERDRERRAAENRTVGGVEIEFENERDRGRIERVGRWARAALDRLRR
jgi:hypothetical protein